MRAESLDAQVPICLVGRDAQERHGLTELCRLSQALDLAMPSSGPDAPRIAATVQRDPPAVVGSITAATGVMRLAGKPERWACSLMSASLGAL